MSLPLLEFGTSSGGGGGSGTVTSFSAGNLAPLFTTSVGTPTTTPSLTFSLSTAAGGTLFGNNTSSAAGPIFTSAPVIGVSGTLTGTIGLASVTASGLFTLTAPSSAATPTLTLPTTSNVLAGQFAGDGTIFNSALNVASAAGTLTPTLIAQANNAVLIGPTSGGPLAPTFRALVAGDLPAGTGTVTSVALTVNGTSPSGIFTVTGSPVTTSGTLNFNLAGTSGGVAYFSSTTVISSSALLASGGLVLGGGSGTAPLTNTQLTFSAPTLTVGLAGTSSGILSLTGSTSGNVTFTAPATAGTATNAILVSNSLQLPSGTVYNWNNDTGLSRDSAGVIDIGTGAAGSIAGSLKLSAITMTGILANSQAGALSASAVSITGAAVTGGSGTTTFPLVYINAGTGPTTFSTSGTQFGINSATGFAGNFIDCHLNGAASVFSVTSAGAVTGSGNITSGANLVANAAGTIGWNASTRMASGSNGVITLFNSAQTAFTRLTFGGTTSSFSALGSSTTNISQQLADGTAGGTFSFTGTVNKYANISTVSQGIPSEIATVDLTAQGAAIASTALYAVPAAGGGMYRVAWVATITRAATTSCVLGGTNGFQINYTGLDDSVVKTSVSGNSITSSANSTGTAISGELIAYIKASTTLNYSFDYTSVGGTTMQYNLHIKCEAM